MYIDTHSQIAMKKTVCKYFGIKSRELSELFKIITMRATRENYFNGDIFNKIVDAFVSSNKPNEEINQILFFHLTRRLNSSNTLGNNLFDLLTTENVLSNFLKSHGVSFSPRNDYLEIYCDGVFKPLEDRHETNVLYLRSRLGYNKGRQDFCFNGFAFKDLLYRNHYARELSDVPEFIGSLATFLGRREIGTDYYLNSTYYCYEYLLPIENVLFDNNEKLSLDGKRGYLINQVILRLYEYSVTDIRYMFDHDNPILRLPDSDTMKEDFFIASEVITDDMLRY